MCPTIQNSVGHSFFIPELSSVNKLSEDYSSSGLILI